MEKLSEDFSLLEPYKKGKLADSKVSLENKDVEGD